MSEGVCFFNVGTKHVARLVVAIHSLRKHYRGEVCILDGTSPADAGTAAIVAQIEDDKRLGVLVQQFTINQLRRNTAYCAKASLWRHSPFARTLLVDADTLFLRSPAPLFDYLDRPTAGGFVVTQFSNWITCGKIVSSRLAKWRGVRCPGLDCEEIVANLTREPWPAINTGVLVFDNSREDARETLELWERLTLAGWRNPWTDELAAQILISRRPHFVAPEIWNSSILYAQDREGAAIRHHHGGKSVRPEDGGAWIAEYDECVSENIANIGAWAPSTDARLAAFLAAR